MKRTVDRIVTLLVRCCDPDEIVLFGSHAKGLGRSDSDLDFLVIAPFRESGYLRGREAEDLLSGLPVSVDLHFVRPEELDADRNPYSFFKSIRMHGVSVYTRDLR